jgi:RNase P subunit RPR2
LLSPLRDDIKVLMEAARSPRPRVTLTCSNCDALARLKMIEAFTFTKSVTEATYKCLECGFETKRAVGTADQTSTRAEAFCLERVP